MQNEYFQHIATNLNVSIPQIVVVKDLLSENCTIPFIARYRKELTKGLDEVKLSEIKDQLDYFCNLEERKQYILKIIEESGKLTDELRFTIINEVDDKRLEDLFMPYKPKRKTRASKAREAGLEPLAMQVLEQKKHVSPVDFQNSICEAYKTPDKVLEGIKDIIAEEVSQMVEIRDFLRDNYKRYGRLFSKKTKNEDENRKYVDYYEYEESVTKTKSHRILAVFRGSDEGVLKSGIAVDEEYIIRFIKKKLLHGYGENQRIYGDAIEDSFKRLLHPSIENETLKELKERADTEAIEVFAENLKQLLLAPPLSGKRVLAIDPGFRTGCKVVCLDSNGQMLHNETIFPHPPQSQGKQAGKKLQSLIDAYKSNVVAIGNGTASRETERFIRSLKFKHDIQVFMVSEDGASIYSASKTAREEFPEYDVTVRGAISIGRRLIDPLAELIKIDPKSIGVGQYQHDVDQNKLKEELDKTVFYCVNEVGVNLNTASYHLLAYISGLNQTIAKNIVEYRKEIGGFTNRNQLKKVARLGPKAFEQSAGFLRIPNAKNPLDNSAVHPESYNLVKRLAEVKGLDLVSICNKDITLTNDEKSRILGDEFGHYTLEDVLKELKQPGRDPRGEVKVFTFNQSINTINDLREEMLLPGIVTNLTNFGAFVDIGIKENGLVHISEICDRFISSPAEEISLHQQVVVKVLAIDLDRKRIQLSIKQAKRN